MQRPIYFLLVIPASSVITERATLQRTTTNKDISFLLDVLLCQKLVALNQLNGTSVCRKSKVSSLQWAFPRREVLKLWIFKRVRTRSITKISSSTFSVILDTCVTKRMVTVASRPLWKLGLSSRCVASHSPTCTWQSKLDKDPVTVYFCWSLQTWPLSEA